MGPTLAQNGANMLSVSCPSIDSCIATGADGDDMSAMTAEGTQSGGIWTWSTPISLTFNNAYFMPLYSVSCPSTTYCVAVGQATYYPNEQIVYPLSVTGTESGGVWTWSQPYLNVSDGTTNSGFRAVSCADVTSCMTVGIDDASQEVFAPWTPELPNLPSAPTIGTATLVSGSPSLTWTAPSNSDGAVTTGYDVLALDVTTGIMDNDACPAQLDQTTTTCSATGLNGGDTYEFAVAAVSDVGIGLSSGFSDEVALPLAVADAPTNVSATASNASASVQWSAPLNDGGTALTGYEVIALNTTTSTTTMNACPTSDSSTALNCSIDGLTNGDSYTFTVAAINSIGTGADSSATASVTPSAPSSGGGGGGGGGATVGPTNAPPPSGLAASAFGTPVSIHVAASGSTTASASLGSASATISVPPGAMPAGTTVSIYPVPSSSTFDSQIPSGSTYVTSFAVSWENPDGTSLNTVTPVTMTITDPNIQAGDTIYVLTSKGLSPAGTATVNGTVTVTFSSDPLYAITSSMVAQAVLSITSTSGHVGTALHLVTSGGSGAGALSFGVVNGTATGCAVTAGALTSQSAGTCIVTATKAADPNYDAVTSNATTIAMALPANPSKVTASFATGSSTLSARAKAELRALAKKLLPGAAVTVTGYAKGHLALAKSRASAVAKYLRQLVRIRVTLKTVLTSHANQTSVTTNKQ
jgi:hypothetical protein